MTDLDPSLPSDPDGEGPTPLPLPLDATEGRFRAWGSLGAKGADHGDPGPFTGPADWSGAVPEAVDERRLLRERNDPERLRKVLRRQKVSEAEIARLTDDGTGPFCSYPSDPVLLEGERIGLERILGKRELVESWFLDAGARAARAVGRVVIRYASGRKKGFGTGSLIGPGLLLTNHHVLPDETSAGASLVEFNADADADGRDRATEAFSLRPDLLFLTDRADGDGLDFTLVAVDPRGEKGGDLAAFGWNRPTEEGDDPILVRQYVNIIQHPRGQPKQIALRDNQVVDLLDNFLHYRAGTEPGSSGAPVFNDHWELVGLHHSGVPRRNEKKEVLTRWNTVWDKKDERDVDWVANEGVRLCRVLARLKAAELGGEGRRLRDGVFTADPAAPPKVKRAPIQNEATVPAPTLNPSASPAPAPSTTGSVTLTVPLQIQIEVKVVVPGAGAAPVVASVTVPATPAPAQVSGGEFGEAVSIDQNYGNRAGYDPEFLGPGALRVGLPELSEGLRASAPRTPDGSYELKYHHYSVVMSRPRRLAVFTAVNIEGARDTGQTRESDRWLRDPRIGKDDQIGNDFYSGTPFDRGHLVRRIDPAWGPDAGVVKVANDDTFHFTNCAPQHKLLNRGLKLWRGLEDFLIGRATADRARMTVFTGPVFDRGADLNPRPDPDYAGVKVPRWYWKVAVVARPGGTLGALGFLVSQSDLVDNAVSDLAAEEAAVDVAETFQVPVSRIAELTGLDFGPLAASEAPSVAGLGRESAGGADQVPLRSVDDLVIPWP